MDYSCRLCGNLSLFPLIDFGEHPIAHRFLSDPLEEEYVHSVSTAICERCGLVQLVDPIPAELLYTNYDWLSSWKIQPHMSRQVQLIEKLPGLIAPPQFGKDDGDEEYCPANG